MGFETNDERYWKEMRQTIDESLDNSREAIEFIRTNTIEMIRQFVYQMDPSAGEKLHNFEIDENTLVLVPPSLIDEHPELRLLDFVRPFILVEPGTVWLADRTKLLLRSPFTM